jgi:hypothetical protein
MAFENLLKQFLFIIAFWPYIVNQKKGWFKSVFLKIGES